MNKIIVIGCPGSGKSTMVFKMQEILKGYKVLHLDKVYHIDNETHISRDELRQIVYNFANSYSKWIIDGNYIATVEERIKLADTIILLDIDTQTCYQNAINRAKKEKTSDMADGFDNSKIKDGFLDFISKFKNESLPKIMESYEKYKLEKNFIILHNYDEIDKFLKNLKETIK